MSTKTPECWENDPHAHCVRIEITTEEFLELPHDEFMYSHLKRDGDGQLLRLVFVTHEVLVRGRALWRIDTAINRMELSALNTLPANQRSLVPDGQPVVIEITVVESAKQESGMMQQ
jgi:hypothetical protein